MNPADLVKLTLYQAVCFYFLSQPMAYHEFYDYDAVDWREWFSLHRN